MITSHVLPSSLLGAVADHAGQTTIKLGGVGKCPDQATLVIGIVDDSGSVTAPGGTDPISNRYTELGMAIHAVARKCRCKQELAAIVHFDSPAGDTRALPLTKQGMAELERGLRVPLLARGTSDMLPSILKATEMALAHPDHQAVAIVFSDFRLTDERPAAPFEALSNFPGTVYGCVLGGGDFDQLPGVDHLLAVDAASPPGAIARALLAALTHHRHDGQNSADRSGRRRFHNAVNTVRQQFRPDDPTSEVGGRADRQPARLPRRRGHGRTPPKSAQ